MKKNVFSKQQWNFYTVGLLKKNFILYNFCSFNFFLVLFMVTILSLMVYAVLHSKASLSPFLVLITKKEQESRIWLNKQVCFHCSANTIDYCNCNGTLPDIYDVEPDSIS